ncbi:MAG TPA: hypothetical protein VFL98_00510 [Candidatus Paceibacterota bacterium]|nr:hypothetical protein [Candidatus Paceibacterota bacterium]
MRASMPRERIGSHRKRDERTHWYNSEPIDDELQIYDLLHYERYYDHDYRTRYLRQRQGSSELELVVQWREDGGGDSAFDYFDLDQDLVQRLIEEQMLAPYRQPYPGGYELRYGTWQMSMFGRDRRLALQREVLVRAHDLIEKRRGSASGHLALARERMSISRARLHGRYGELHAKFPSLSGPSIETLIVNLATGEITET